VEPNSRREHLRGEGIGEYILKIKIYINVERGSERACASGTEFERNASAGGRNRRIYINIYIYRERERKRLCEWNRIRDESICGEKE